MYLFKKKQLKCKEKRQEQICLSWAQAWFSGLWSCFFFLFFFLQLNRYSWDFGEKNTHTPLKNGSQQWHNWLVQQNLKVNPIN